MFSSKKEPELPAPKLKGITLAEWRTNPVAIETARKLLSSQGWRYIEAILEENSPAKVYRVPFGAPDSEYVRSVGREEGFLLVMEIIRSLKEELEVPAEVNETFEDETTPS